MSAAPAAKGGAAPKTFGNAKMGGQKLTDSGARDIRSANILAATAVADSVRTSLGPKGVDKMIEDPRGEVII